MVAGERSDARLSARFSGNDKVALDETIRKAIEIRDGVIQNPKILSFQHRAADYPHPHVDTS